MAEPIFPVERITDIQAAPQEFRLQERVPLTRPDILACLPYKIQKMQDKEEVCPLVFIAINTTGLEAARELTIELALVRCTYSISRHTLLSVDRFYSEYEDPRFPLSETVKQHTQLTNQDLAGRYFDESQVRQLLADRPLMISFSPSFVRPFFERRFPSFADLSWSNAGDAAWQELGFHHHRLPYLLTFENYFYKYGSAAEQALAVCFLMTLAPMALEQILEKATLSEYVIEAKNFPFESKDQLKELGFRWDGTKKLWKYWAKDKESFDQVWAAFSTLNPNYNAAQKAAIYQVTARERYKAQ